MGEETGFLFQKIAPLIVELFAIGRRVILATIIVLPNDPVMIEMWVGRLHAEPRGRELIHHPRTPGFRATEYPRAVLPMQPGVSGRRSTAGTRSRRRLAPKICSSENAKIGISIIWMASTQRIYHPLVFLASGFAARGQREFSLTARRNRVGVVCRRNCRQSAGLVKVLAKPLGCRAARNTQVLLGTR
jgi:hypothetical protein